MHVGAAMFFTDYSMESADLARECEARGLESMWAPEHSHIPVSRGSGFPSGGELPRQYSDAMDPFVSLSAAAAVTNKIKLGTGVCLVIQRDPIQTAKLVASLDRVSKGRFLFGVGGGWNAEEMADHGTEFKSRFKLMRERIEAMKEIWTKEQAEFHGEFINFSLMWSAPKPLQPGGPPILMGGESRHNYARVLDYCDGWIPHSTADIGERVRELREAAEKAKRPFESLLLTAFRVDPKESEVEPLIKAGFQRIVFGIRAAGREVVLPALDTCVKVATKFS